MDTAEMAVILSMQEDVSSKAPVVANSLMGMKSAMRELSMGTMYMGSMFLGLSMSLDRMNNSTAKSVASMLAMVGGIMTAVGSAAHFINAAGKIAHALDAINIKLIIQRALSGPTGWAILAGATVAAGAAVYGVSKMGKSETASKVEIHQHIAGSVVTNRELIDNAHQGLLMKQDRAYKTGLR